MSLRRVSWLAAAGLATLLWVSCGQVYRPVVLPVATIPPNPASFHEVFALSTNIPSNQGAAMQIDVAGDSNIGEAYVGVNPTHAGILPNNSRVFVASAGSLFTGDTDTVTAFTPAFDVAIATGLGTPTTISYPNIGTIQSASIVTISENGSGNGNVTATLNSALSLAAAGQVIAISGVNATGTNPTGYDGTFTITSVNGATIQYTDGILGLPAASGGTAALPLTCSYQPDYVTTTQTTAVFVANYGAENSSNCNISSTDSVAILSPSLNSISLIQYLPPASHPVAMVETPDSLNLYVLNQNNTVVNLSPTDLTTQANVPLGGSTVPVWAVARPDAQKVYLVTQGDGSLQTITTATNTITSTQSVGGPGANFVLYDNSRNRLYVTNPGNGSTAGALYVFDATTDPPTPLGNATGVVSVPAPSSCSVLGVTCGPVTPVSVTALSDGSRFYVASYVTASMISNSKVVCPDNNVTTLGACVIPQLTIFDAASLTVKPVSNSSNFSASLSLFGQPLFAASQYAISEVAGCVPLAPYTPATIRFRMFASSSTDASHVYVALCDAGAIADIATSTTTLPTGGTNTPDILITDLAAPLSAAGALAGGNPPPQNPVFLLTGQ